MKILFYLGHPAHFYLFKEAINYFKEKGEVLILIKEKDVLETVLINSKLEFKNILKKERGNTKLSMFSALLKKDWRMAKEAFYFKPDIMVGSAPEIAHIGFLLRIPSLLFGEDDLHVVPQAGYIAYPFATNLVSPYCCDKGKWNKKTINYNSYHELAYLNPKYFTPEKEIAEKYVNTDVPYFLVRFAKLAAYHDKDRKGINDDLAIQIIKELENKGDVYIISERKLSEKLQKYRLSIDPLDIHHLLAFSSLYIGDSQTMCAEASVLGIPSIRYNDFVGEIGYLEELEHKYGLTKGIKTNKPQELLDTVEIYSNPLFKKEIKLKRDKMIGEKIDFAAFMIWLIENYPESKTILGEDLKYQERFKS